MLISSRNLRAPLKEQWRIKMSEAQRKYLKKRKIRLIVTHFLRLVLLAAFIGGWELVARFNIIDPFIISCPSRIVKVLATLETGGDLSKHVLASLYETVAGFLIATALGSVIAVLLWKINDKLDKK